MLIWKISAWPTLMKPVHIQIPAFKTNQPTKIFPGEVRKSVAGKDSKNFASIAKTWATFELGVTFLDKLRLSGHF